MRITVKDIKNRHACRAGVQQFLKFAHKYGDGRAITVTTKICKKIGTDGQWDWLAVKLFKTVDYDKFCQRAIPIKEKATDRTLRIATIQLREQLKIQKKFRRTPRKMKNRLAKLNRKINKIYDKILSKEGKDCGAVFAKLAKNYKKPAPVEMCDWLR